METPTFEQKQRQKEQLIDVVLEDAGLDERLSQLETTFEELAKKVEWLVEQNGKENQQ